MNENGYENHGLLETKGDSACIPTQSLTKNKSNGIANHHDSNGPEVMGESLLKKFSFENQKDQNYKPLTFWRLLRGIACLTILVITAFMILIFFAPPSFVILRIFSLPRSRKVVAFLFGQWLAMWPFLFEKINGTKIIFSGESVPPKERVLLICNHRTEVDWMYIWNLAVRKGRLGYVKYILKSSVRNVPIFGWAFYVLEFILVDRKWNLDKIVIESMLSTFKDPKDPLWLVIFPEGTDFTEKKCSKSQEEAKKHNRPVLSNVLLPRTKGFHTSFTILKDSVDAVYDVTIAYKNQSPVFMDNAFGTDPAEVHINVRRLQPDEIPSSELETATWLDETFREKDELLSVFEKEGSFPHCVNEEALPTFKCLISIFVMVISTVVLFNLLISSSFWIKFYVAASCVYLAAATSFNSRPCQLFGYFCKGKANTRLTLQDSCARKRADRRLTL